MLIDVASANFLDVYRLLIGIVTPRPIAWVTSIDPEGRVNLAPFSFYNAFSADPPVVVFSPTLRRDGAKKDTLRNVEATREFVLNAAVEALAEQVNLSSKELPYGQSEVEYTGLTLRPSLKVKPPRIAESPVNMECKLIQIVPLGSGPIAGNLVIGEVVMMHVDDEVLDAKGAIDPRKLKTIARLGGDYYCRTSDLFEMKRPQ
ncbi:MAG: flavin reductase family protein [Planctomycetota bacterium]|nr:MAG: flavin reductase family protein [Planctomycetota bacterium]